MIIGSFQELVHDRDCDCVIPEEGGCIVSNALELRADKTDLTLKNWYELASNTPGHNATVFETSQLEIYEISVFLKATRKLALAFVFPHDSCVCLVSMLLIVT